MIGKCRRVSLKLGFIFLKYIMNYVGYMDG